MKKILCMTLLIVSTALNAEEAVRTLNFDAGGNAVDVSADPMQPLQTVLSLDVPGVTLPVYAIKGMVRYDSVAGEGFLQMDNHFEGHGTFFTKSLAADGPLQSISGGSDWRAFTLPFYANQGGNELTPDRITLSVVLPESGTVSLRDLTLYQYADGSDPMRATGQWVAAKTAILFGAFGGALVGVWGGLIGMLAGRGKARGFVMGSATFLLVLGVISLCLGVAAFALGQPYVIFYPLLLIGVIVTLVVGGLRRTLPRRYEAHEMKKMQAMDV